MTAIRRMKPGDAEAVSVLLGDSWRRTYAPLLGETRAAGESDARHAPARLAEELDVPGTAAFVAETEEKAIAGYAMAETDNAGQVWLERLHIAPDSFGSGIAAALLRAVVDTYAGSPSLALEVIKGNDRARAFYAKHGFAVVEERAACGSMQGVPTLVMRLPLEGR